MILRSLVMLLALCLPATAQEAQRFNPRQALTTTVPAPPMQIYVAVDGQQTGPMTAAEFAAFLGNPAAAASTYVWMPGMSEWAVASAVAALQPVIASIGQGQGQGQDQSPAVPPDPSAFMLGLWVSERFEWTIQDTKHDAIVQMKLAPDGSFEGVTLFQKMGQDRAPIIVANETGTWSVASESDRAFRLLRKISYMNVLDGEVIGNGQMDDTWVLKSTGPNNVISKENIDFVRVSAAGG